MSRRPLDSYDTPAYLVGAIVPELPTHGTILDPCAGTGDILEALVAHGVDRRRMFALEIDERRAATCRERMPRGCAVVDALQATWAPADLVITNPPYSQAQAFVEKALHSCRCRGGTVAMLLRLTFLESAARYQLHRDFPSDVFVFSRRPSFTGGGTDSCTVAWFVWGPGRGGRWTVLDSRAEVPT